MKKSEPVQKSTIFLCYTTTSFLFDHNTRHPKSSQKSGTAVVAVGVVVSVAVVVLTVFVVAFRRMGEAVGEEIGEATLITFFVTFSRTKDEPALLGRTDKMSSKLFLSRYCFYDRETCEKKKQHI